MAKSLLHSLECIHIETHNTGDFHPEQGGAGTFGHKVYGGSCGRITNLGLGVLGSLRVPLRSFSSTSGVGGLLERPVYCRFTNLRLFVLETFAHPLVLIPERPVWANPKVLVSVIDFSRDTRS
jgi:hypothetical protein